MDTILIVVLVLVVAAVAIYGVVQYKRHRSEKLRGEFGPEYERTVEETSDKRAAEKDLISRKERRGRFEIRPLDPQARRNYQQSWSDTQAKFVDSPGQATREADALIILVMRDRGYPVDDFDQRSADISVDHPLVVENYRAAHAVSMANERGEATTEDLRRAMVHYRKLFEELVGASSQTDSDRIVDVRESDAHRAS